MPLRPGSSLVAPLLAALAACGAGDAGVTVEAPAVGEVAPDIVGVDLDGVQFQLSDYRGKVVLLDFWGDW